MRIWLCLLVLFFVAPSALGWWWGDNDNSEGFESQHEMFNATVCLASSDWSQVWSVDSEKALDVARYAARYKKNGVRARYFGIIPRGHKCSPSADGMCLAFERAGLSGDEEKNCHMKWKQCVKLGGTFVHDRWGEVEHLGSDVFTSPLRTSICCLYDATISPFPLTHAIYSSRKECKLHGMNGVTFGVAFWDDGSNRCPQQLKEEDVSRITCCALAGESTAKAVVREITSNTSRTYYNSVGVLATVCADEASQLVLSEDMHDGGCPPFEKESNKLWTTEQREMYWIVERIFQKNVMATHSLNFKLILFLIFEACLSLGCLMYFMSQSRPIGESIFALQSILAQSEDLRSKQKRAPSQEETTSDTMDTETTTELYPEQTFVVEEDETRSDDVSDDGPPFIPANRHNVSFDDDYDVIYDDPLTQHVS